MRRNAYVALYGPTVGDKLHLADSGLIVEIEKDYNTYGDEAVFGGGKTLRDGCAQAPGVSSADGALDFVITNITIIDPFYGVVKGDIGIKDGRIVGIGKAGNPDIMDITPGLIVSPNTDIFSADPGMIATAGGIDVHVHFDSLGLAWEALSNGITTMLGGGTGPKTVGIEAPGAFNIQRMIEAFEGIPVNMGQLGKGNSSRPDALVDQVLGGCLGLKLHEDWGSTPAAIDQCLRIADAYDFQVQIHTDTLNESGFLERTLEAIGGRTIHAYHTEGAGGGHAPDILMVCGMENILPSSTNPTNPYTINTVEEHLDMIMTCHHLNPKAPEDVAFADSRIRAQSIAAEDVLHDLGAISMLGSDSQGMGRMGESILRTWQLAAKNKAQRGKLPEETGDNDNQRVLRYLAKYTINPAITFGISDDVGSLRPGRLADIVIWKHSFFGAKPEIILKGGFIAWSVMGESNASLMTCEPVKYRPQYGAAGGAPNSLAKIFVTQAALDHGLAERLPVSAKKLLPVKYTRKLRKADMLFNNYCPDIRVDPESYKVYVDGNLIASEPATVLPLAQKYFFR
ncbi:MAG: urease subunit alpha [Peptococcaceae bacterium]|jgi:urease subunit alpha|nr:urease subunit alpha [Peptococcaceae bacterium]